MAQSSRVAMARGLPTEPRELSLMFKVTPRTISGRARLTQGERAPQNIGYLILLSRQRSNEEPQDLATAVQAPPTLERDALLCPHVRRSLTSTRVMRLKRSRFCADEDIPNSRASIGAPLAGSGTPHPKSRAVGGQPKHALVLCPLSEMSRSSLRGAFLEFELETRVAVGKVETSQCVVLHCDSRGP